MNNLTYFILLSFSILHTPIVSASNIDESNKYAWSSSSGWIDFRPEHGGVTIYSDHLEGYAYAANIGWIKLGNYEQGKKHTYINTSATNWGVNNDDSGNLSGYAWSKTVGWINFNSRHKPL